MTLGWHTLTGLACFVEAALGGRRGAIGPFTKMEAPALGHGFL